MSSQSAPLAIIDLPVKGRTRLLHRARALSLLSIAWMTVEAGVAIVAAVAAGSVPDMVLQHLVPVKERPRPFAQRGVAYLPILPRITLLIVGGGHVGQAVARLGAEVDFDVWVLGDRDRYVSPERFPSASKLITGDIGGTLQDLAKRHVTPSTYCLIVTRGHGHDVPGLAAITPRRRVSGTMNAIRPGYATPSLAR